MRNLVSVLCLMALVGCAGISTESFVTETPVTGIPQEFKVVEVHRTNWWAPSYTYHFLYACQQSICAEVQQNPTIQAGVVTTLAPAMIQAGGLVGAGALVGNGLRHAGSQTTVNGGNANASASGGSATGGSATSTSSATTSNSVSDAPGNSGNTGAQNGGNH